MRKSISDFLAGLGFLAIAIAFWVQYGHLSGVSRVFPEALITFIGLGGIYFVLKGLWFLYKERQSAAIVTESDQAERVRWGRVGAIAALSVVFLPLIHQVGFFVSSTVFLFISATILGEKSQSLIHRIGISLIYAVLFNTCVWLLFVKLLKVPTPQGLLF